ncbi:MAG: NlpC/P60 family protein [Minisyncoccia bacterium]
MIIPNHGGRYRAVGNRCAFGIQDPKTCHIEYRLENTKQMRAEIAHLKYLGFKFTYVDVVKLARKLIGVSQWKLKAASSEAPDFVDCSSLVKWVYGQKGIWLPRRAFQQYWYTDASFVKYCADFSSLQWEMARPGDLLFVSSPYVQGIRTENHGRLHVGILTGEKTVISATNSEFGKGVVEISLQKILETRKFRGIGQVVENKRTATLIVPSDQEVETNDDLYFLLGHLRKSHSPIS